MTKRPHESDIQGVNPGYAVFQIAKVLTTSEEHKNADIRERAKEKISRWKTILTNILTGTVEYGSNTPVKQVPKWATLEVVTGGFATGELLAGGPLLDHEKTLLGDLTGIKEGEERRTLNAWFLSEPGLEMLRYWLRTGCYDVTVPEEGALLVVAWLVDNGFAEDARKLIEVLSPYFPLLRFYPIPLEKPRRFGSRVHLQDAESTLEDLKQIGPNNRILAQKEAVEIWAPIYDRIVSLFFETVENDWPCQRYPEGWSDRARALLSEYTELRKAHTHCGKMERANRHCAQLREFLERCAQNPYELTGREVGRIRLILKRYVEKRGKPDSTACTEARRRQAADVIAPMFHEIAGVIVSRFENHSREYGPDDIHSINVAVSKEEAVSFGVPEGTAIPHSIQHKVERCLNDTVDVLVERGLITSGETLARVLPQMTSGIRAAGIIDSTLRQLYAGIYCAFRRRRSLLLLNLEKQIQIEDLPWVTAIDRFRNESLSNHELAKQTLKELTLVTLTSFPHAILPNKLLQELRALAKESGINIPLVDELAADIFMGTFSKKFFEAAMEAADLLEGSLYATYYGIDYNEIRKIQEVVDSSKSIDTYSNMFAKLCASRAGASLETWDPVTNGMIIEQQQILTTQNLAALYKELDLSDALLDLLGDMARHCFRWICRRQQMKVDLWHARLTMLKNTAYAWRQMIFFLSLLSNNSVSEFLKWAENHLDKQQDEFRNRFNPALKSLIHAANCRSLDTESLKQFNIQPFLGWSKGRHWLLPDVSNQ